ncbi:phosphoethanolamine transferase [Thiomicrorhabdus sp. Kp2]|uniref:phosphoethanolamine transferase n=1 Tax=Thiomicrorhabdus sp. Kp2 TaxID=1123518 RepID=UPI000594D83C|nr:phosphoethanolamine transferase [Thiomicrorhabdus sp. Kp2]
MKQYLSHSSAITLWILMFPLIAFLLMAEEFHESEITARMGWLILLIAFSYLVRIRFLYLLVLLPFVLSGVVDLFYTSTFNQQFEASLVRVLTDTDSQETQEFLSVYLGPFNLSILALYFAGLFYLGRELKFFRPQSFKTKLLVVGGVLMLIVAVQQIWFHDRYKDVLPGAFGQMTDGVKKYYQVQNEMKKRPELLANYQLPVLKEEAKPQTYIVVIGESAARKHHGLFGYQRNTNPLLESIKKDLILFNDVVSPFAVTYLSLSHTLTEKNLNNKTEFADSLSIVGLSKKAGFKTWWISNQPKYEGTTLSLSLVADHAEYVSGSGGYDEVVLPAVERALKDKSSHKVIFVHLRGSHMTYNKRYPQTYQVFDNKKGIEIYSKEPSKKQIEVVNAYDNSIVYTDKILFELIQSLETKDSISGLVYFADHGEEVYDYKDFIGHELKRITPVMFEVPFIVWVNDLYKNRFQEKVTAMKSQHKMPFLNDDFFDFGLCFMGIDADISKQSSSPCEPNFTPKKRVVAGQLYQDGKLYD